jgi:uracil-DNA glycosylase
VTPSDLSGLSGLDQTDSLAGKIIACRQCPRLLKHCKAVAQKKIMRRKTFLQESYWGRPVPNFGELPAKLLVVGLAPGAHGSNRTSRMFTGDDSGLWLYRALHKSGFSETAGCSKVGDNRLIDCSITSVIHCAPPGNKPEAEEIEKCEPFLIQTIRRAKPKVILALGSVAWSSAMKAIEKEHSVSFGRGQLRTAFKHGAQVTIELPTKGSKAEPQRLDLLASYHVSRQNTNTGRLTEPMLDAVFATARSLIHES